jgi:uncharacterized protein (TIGR02186 family)
VCLAHAPVTVSLSEHVIRITPRYRGEMIRVQGTAPEGCDVVVKLTAASGDARYSRKGKVGPLWLSVGQVRFKNVPGMYKVKSTRPLDDLLPTAEQVIYGLGRRGLKASMTAPPGPARKMYLDELILIRERDRFFSFGEGQVQREGERFSATFYWPPNGPPGRYHVEAYAIQQRRIVGSAATEVVVRIVGIEAWVRDLAAAHGVLYGIIAVVIALAAGLTASLAFSGSPRRWSLARLQQGT